MSLRNNSSPTTELSYYGKKVYYLNEEIAQRIAVEQLKQTFMYEDIELYNSDILH